MSLSNIFNNFETVSAIGFIANQSSYAVTQLTNSIHLRPGTWLIVIKTPYSTNSGEQKICKVGINGVNASECLIGNYITFPTSYGTAEIVIKTTEAKDIYLEVISTMDRYTWDSNFLNRGGLIAIRLGD